MNGGLVPLFLLGGTLALMLAFVPLRTTMVGLLAFAASGLCSFFVPLSLPQNALFIGFWLSLVLTTLAVYFPARRWAVAVIPLALNAGFWMGIYAGLTNNLVGLALGSAAALAAIPAKWLIAHHFDIIIKVVASWLIAIASLSMFVSLMPTPGYKPDHKQ